MNTQGPERPAVAGSPVLTDERRNEIHTVRDALGGTQGRARAAINDLLASESALAERVAELELMVKVSAQQIAERDEALRTFAASPSSGTALGERLTNREASKIAIASLERAERLRAEGRDREARAASVLEEATSAEGPWFGCFTGDCPHETQSQCDAEIRSEFAKLERDVESMGARLEECRKMRNALIRRLGERASLSSSGSPPTSPPAPNSVSPSSSVGVPDPGSRPDGPSDTTSELDGLRAERDLWRSWWEQTHGESNTDGVTRIGPSFYAHPRVASPRQLAIFARELAERTARSPVSRGAPE